MCRFCLVDDLPVLGNKIGLSKEDSSFTGYDVMIVQWGKEIFVGRASCGNAFVGLCVVKPSQPF